MVVDGWWDTGRPCGGRKKHNFRKYLKNCSIFLLTVSDPHRRVVKTFFLMFQIGKTRKFSNQKISNVIFSKKSVEKYMLFVNISKTNRDIFLIVSATC